MSQANTSASPGVYLRTKVLTASPEDLRLMLYEGAVKFCRQARHALSQRDIEGMYNGIVRAQKIVLELSTSLDHKTDADLCGKLAALYNYIYLRLVDANMERDTAPLDEATNLLDYQRETWALAIRKLREGGAPSATSSEAAPAAPPEIKNPIGSIGRRAPGFNAPAPASSFSVQG